MRHSTFIGMVVVLLLATGAAVAQEAANQRPSALTASDLQQRAVDRLNALADQLDRETKQASSDFSNLSKGYPGGEYTVLVNKTLKDLKASNSPVTKGVLSTPDVQAYTKALEFDPEAAGRDPFLVRGQLFGTVSEIVGEYKADAAYIRALANSIKAAPADNAISLLNNSYMPPKVAALIDPPREDTTAFLLSESPSPTGLAFYATGSGRVVGRAKPTIDYPAVVQLMQDYGERVMTTAVIEIEMGRDQQIDVPGGEVHFRQAGNDVVLRAGVVQQRPPRVGGLGADEGAGIAGIDLDDAAARGADQVARHHPELGHPGLVVRSQPAEMHQIELVRRHAADYPPTRHVDSAVGAGLTHTITQFRSCRATLPATAVAAFQFEAAIAVPATGRASVRTTAVAAQTTADDRVAGGAFATLLPPLARAAQPAASPGRGCLLIEGGAEGTASPGQQRFDRGAPRCRRGDHSAQAIEPAVIHETTPPCARR